MAVTAAGARLVLHTSGRRRVVGAWAAAVAALVAAGAVGVLVGAAELPAGGVALEVLDRLPLVSVESGLSERDSAILWQLRLPRVVLGVLVGALLAVAGAGYQGVFRNPLVDPYLLGAGAGAGLGATLALAAGARDGWGPIEPVPLAAFAGASGAVALSYLVGTGRGRTRSANTLVLAGVAVMTLLTALQTYVQQQHQETIREVYDWILGRLTTAGWHEVLLVLPWAVVSVTVLLVLRRPLDVLSVGDDEAGSLGLDVARVRLVAVGAATAATAAAVSVGGLIGFVGIIVPHTVRLLVGTGNRLVLPLTLVAGGAFLVLADVVARTVQSPAEVPIGVVTALAGAPFFLLLLGRRGR